ncbi:MAG TPA: hypothetical protein VIK45_00725 [Candidatus Dormibacteraeota bacterium]|jgi:ABC-type multidrug transport system fused ATPase/permease subunit
MGTIMHADRIVVLVDGRIVQSGVYDELLAQPGQFRALATGPLTWSVSRRRAVLG